MFCRGLGEAVADGSSEKQIPRFARDDTAGDEGNMEQYTFVRLRAREGEESAVEEALREVMAPTREEAGCLSFHTFRSMRDQAAVLHSFAVGG